jgi:NAD(P)-dependent dehydrogenase (short-subunit alcohol dehydrogenase family)
MAPLTWLVTGATSGLGAALIEALVARGERVIASGRNVEKRLGHLHSENLALLELDITSSFSDIKTQIAHAWTIFGKIDVLMNNAGMSSMRSAEEAEYVAQLDPPASRMLSSAPDLD